MRRVLAGLAVSGAVVIGLAGPAAALTGSQSFTIVAEGDDPGTVVATGPISGLGWDVENDAIEQAAFTFPGGTVTVDHPQTEEGSEESFDPRSCFGRAEFEGTYTLKGGTGAYQGVKGGGTYHGRAFFLAKRNADGTCSQTESELNLFVVNATGTTTLP